jgi:phosphoribosylamine--glycine ligase
MSPLVQPTRILIVGSGGREHALAWKLAAEPGINEVLVAPGSAGIATEPRVRCEGVDPLDPAAVVAVARRFAPELVVIGPEAPLAAGVADALTEAGFAVFGPTAAAAQIESSKAFCREVAEAAGVPMARGRAFAQTDPSSGLAYAMGLDHDGRVVIKADGLAAGKGVTVCESVDEAAEAISAQPDAFVVEERLAGREASVIALCDGRSAIPLPIARDHKRLRDGDIGPNTGGMGAYSPVPWFGTRELEEATASIFEPIAWRMARDGTPYRGVLYAGLMLTDAGPMVLEFNARFGDPEAQVLLPLLEGGLSQALLATATGDRAAMEGAVGLDGRSAVGVVVAAEGYPANPVSGRALVGAEPTAADDAGPLLRFHAGTQRAADGSYWSSGGRVVTIVGIADDLAAAREVAYRGVADVQLEGGQHRADIGLREV